MACPKGLDGSSNSSRSSIPKEEQFEFLYRSRPIGTKSVKALSKKKGKRKKAIEANVYEVDDEDIVQLASNMPSATRKS